MTATEMKITQTQVTHRPAFLPKIVSGSYQLMLLLENSVYALTEKYDPTYQGGYWEYLTAENGARWMQAPEPEIMVHVVNPDNWFDGEMSRGALSIGVMLIVCSHLSFKAPGCKSIVKNFHALREVASSHPESDAIFGLID
ncbi:antirestriction protein [Photobacterium halotolerans]|uniref:antirestriction protein n=1 Tax=Photobacterium halotolerans TaxID=265726 RepID=UPI00047F6A84|nr:antirestriction protein [Photobacterium halotolerans]